MPARRERLTICPGDDGAPVRIVDFPYWWDRRAFFEEFARRQVDTGNPFYVDYGLLLTGGEARAWHKRAQETFAADPLSCKPHNVEAIARLSALLGSARWVIAESYEWESGLD